MTMSLHPSPKRELKLYVECALNIHKLLLIICALFIHFSIFASFDEGITPSHTDRKLTAIVTGANRGIGLEFCKQLTERGYDVLAVCRKTNENLDAIPCEVIAGIDITNDADIATLSEKCKSLQIDLLINNAGMGLDDAFWDADRASLLSQFDNNAIGPFMVTKALKTNLTENAKVIMISSRMGSISTVQTTKGWREELFVGYSVSKTALNMFVCKMAIAFKQNPETSQIAVLALHPGYVKTDLTEHQGDITTETSVSGMLEQIDKLSPETSGAFIQFDGSSMGW